MKNFCCLFSAVVLLFMLIWPAEAKINMFPKPRYIPPLSFYGDSGKAYRLKDFKADLLMAVVWSRRCGPCISEMKYLDKFAVKMQSKGIKVILISPEKDWKTLDEKRLFLERIGAPHLISYVDKKAVFADGMGISVTPTVFLVNRNGEEAGQITGAVKWSDPEVLDYMLKLKDDMSKSLDEQETADE